MQFFGGGGGSGYRTGLVMVGINDLMLCSDGLK